MVADCRLERLRAAPDQRERALVVQNESADAKLNNVTDGAGVAVTPKSPTTPYLLSKTELVSTLPIPLPQVDAGRVVPYSSIKGLGSVESALCDNKLKEMELLASLDSSRQPVDRFLRWPLGSALGRACVKDQNLGRFSRQKAAWVVAAFTLGASGVAEAQPTGQNLVRAQRVADARARARSAPVAGFTDKEIADHKARIGLVTSTAAKYLRDTWKDHVSFYRKHGISRYYGERSSR